MSYKFTEIKNGLIEISEGDDGVGTYPANFIGCPVTDYLIFINSDKQIHREDGPALVDYNGGQYWFNKNKYHREDGPAVITPDGHKYWYLDEYEYTNRNAYIQQLVKDYNKSPKEIERIKAQWK